MTLSPITSLHPPKTLSDVDPEIGCQGHFLAGSPEKQPALFMRKRCPQKPAILHGQNPFKSNIFQKQAF
jgi:hypothetical protein